MPGRDQGYDSTSVCRTYAGCSEAKNCVAATSMPTLKWVVRPKSGASVAGGGSERRASAAAIPDPVVSDAAAAAVPDSVVSANYKPNPNAVRVARTSKRRADADGGQKKKREINRAEAGAARPQKIIRRRRTTRRAR